MDDTLLPLDEAYNSGKRSRGNSFNGGASTDHALYTQPHLQFRELKKHDSDGVRAEYNVQTSAVSPYLDTTYYPSHSGTSSLNTTSPSKINLAPDLPSAPTQDNLDLAVEADLDAAFSAALYMDDGSRRTGSPHAPAPYVNDMDRAYQDSLENMAHVSSSQPMSYSSQAPMFSEQQNYTNAQFGAIPLFEDRIDQHESPYDVGSMQNLQPVGSQAQHFYKISNTTDWTNSRTKYQTEDSVPANYYSGHVARKPSTLRPKAPHFDHYTSLEVPSPFSDSNSFDGSSYDDQFSEPAEPLTLSRTHSINSQYQSHGHHDHISQSSSPFVADQSYASPSMHPMYGSAVAPSSSTQSQLHNAHLNIADQQSMAGYGANPHELQDNSPSSNPLYAFDAPNIAIDPPTPGFSMFSKQNSELQPSFPFPQIVPIITTTSAPNMHNINEDPPGSTAYLNVDQRSRGRSRSESGPHNLHSVRSRSNSSAPDSSSSSTRSHSRSGLQLPPESRSSSHSRVSKPSSQHRRASWCGVRDHFGTDFPGGRESQQINSKQKNPATFICPIDGCNKAFTRAYNLRSHQRTHTNERPFLCDICGKGFARQHDRKRHEKLHTNEKPFECPGCRKTFARMDALSVRTLPESNTC